MNKVGGAIDGVDDPGGLVGQDARLTCSHRLLPYEPDTHTHTHITHNTHTHTTILCVVQREY